MPESVYSSLPEAERESAQYDEGDWMENNWLWKGMAKLVRAESMNISNDPRFFAGNVMDKRLAAFQTLTIVNSLMFGTALKQCFQLKKDMDFSKREWLVGSIAFWQIASFFIAMAIAIMCLVSLYIIGHQLFYTYRLMTAGASGFEQAAIFYLTRSITTWRHLSIKFLFNGLLLFLVLVAIQLLVKFYKDAEGVPANDYEEVVIMNLQQGQSMNTTHVHIDVQQKLDMKVHVVLGYLSLFICIATACFMRHIRYQHLEVFRQNYEFCSEKTHRITTVLRGMAYRSGTSIET
jgi:hypothetical protein